ncbi:MAG: GIY-YIG nuclease family protein [Firmicutes bacterium]|nr:GIY-YIG nuclease family protein [Bacillota bacterium]
MDSGVYVVWLYLPEQTTITIGKLGTYPFPSGIYAYAGSAQRNLRHRVQRHRRLDKRLHWHVDYLRPHCSYLGDVVFQGQPKQKECWLVQELLRIPSAYYVVPRFGASDCKCGSHLVSIPIAEPKNM